MTHGRLSKYYVDAYEYVVIQCIYIRIICLGDLTCCFIEENNLVGGKCDVIFEIF